MLLNKAVSGQYIHLMLVNISGNLQTLASGQISGTRTVDAGVRTLLSGNIVETSGGGYRVNLYDWDTSGNNIGYMFTASGCIPIGYTFATVDSTSGRVYPASGVNATVPPATQSGLFATASLNSGQSVLVYSGQLSGQPMTLLSGRSYTASGIFATATATIASGALSGQLVDANVTRWAFAPVLSGTSGAPVVDLGYSRGVVVTNEDGTLVSGTATTVQFPSAAAGGGSIGDDNRYEFKELIITDGAGAEQRVLLTSGTASGGRIYNVLSGTMPVAVASGSKYVLGGTWLATPLSGVYVNATATVTSGTLYLASGSLFKNTFASGVLGTSGGIPTSLSGGVAQATATVNSGLFVTASLNSGQQVLVYSGQMSGYAVTPASGANVTVPPSTLSGVFGTASLNSGQFTLPYSGQMSGQPGGTLSGQTWLAPFSVGSGQFMSGVISKLFPQSQLTYDFSGAPDVSGQRNQLNAQRKLVNAWDVDTTASGYLSVFREDDATLAFRQALTSVSGASLVTGVDTQ